MSPSAGGQSEAVTPRPDPKRRLVATLLAISLGAATAAIPSAPAASQERREPRTGFEKRNGASWTTEQEELDFLDAVNRGSSRVEIDRIGKSAQGRPLHLVQVGQPRPASISAAARDRVILFICSQHGNEPAGRETCLKVLRDLGFTQDPKLIELLQTWTMIFVPNANPDGRAADDRENADGVDVNRDHLNLTTLEAQAMATVIRDWRPDIVLDLHEFYTFNDSIGGAAPVLNDEEILYLWPRNLNVDESLHRLSKSLAIDYIEEGAEEAGYSADEYGKFDVGDQDLLQYAGDHDEGILRNLVGLRGSIGVLIEANQTPDPRNGAAELVNEAEVNLRRVASQYQTVVDTFRFMQDHGRAVEKATERALLRYAAEGRHRSEPVYFGGADNDPPEESEVQDPPPCAYRLTRDQGDEVRDVLKLLAISARRDNDGIVISMAQPSEPLIPLLLDARAERHAVQGEPVMKC